MFIYIWIILCQIKYVLQQELWLSGCSSIAGVRKLELMGQTWTTTCFYMAMANEQI